MSPFMVVGMVFIFMLATLALSKTARTASQLQHLVNTRVNVQAANEGLPGNVADTFDVLSIRGFGAALFIILRPPDGEPALLKIAQPARVTFTEMSLQIDHARYIQWKKGPKRYLPSSTTPALKMEVVG
jgi:hypothetical protein